MSPGGGGGAEGERVPPAKSEGMKFARRLLLSTWDQVLDILAVNLDTKSTGMVFPELARAWFNDKPNQYMRISL